MALKIRMSLRAEISGSFQVVAVFFRRRMAVGCCNRGVWTGDSTVSEY